MQAKAAATVVVAALAIVSLSGAATSVAPPHKTYKIMIDKMKFGTVPSTLRVGDTIIWVNRDIFRHTATATDRTFNIDLMPAKSVSMVLKRAGTFQFVCTYHPGMKGRMIVARE